MKVKNAIGWFLGFLVSVGVAMLFGAYLLTDVGREWCKMQASSPDWGAVLVLEGTLAVGLGIMVFLCTRHLYFEIGCRMQMTEELGHYVVLAVMTMAVTIPVLVRGHCCWAELAFVEVVVCVMGVVSTIIIWTLPIRVDGS